MKTISTLAAIAVLTSVSLNAIPTVETELTTGSGISVGDTFDVAVGVSGVDYGVQGDLAGWGFTVDTLSLNILQFEGVAVDANFFDDSFLFGPDDVVGTITPSGTTSSVFPLATLSFTALDYGVETLNLSGLIDGFFGLYFFDGSEYDIQSSLAIEVQRVPDAGTTITLALFAMASLAGIRQRMRDC